VARDAAVSLLGWGTDVTDGEVDQNRSAESLGFTTYSDTTQSSWEIFLLANMQIHTGGTEKH
jgi:hypothetical protein